MKDGYKIRLRRAGYRLAYRVDGDGILVTVLAIGRREGNEACAVAAGRTGSGD
ncbi:hypothetical protein GCM10027202_35900 [Microvirgula curvata]